MTSLLPIVEACDNFRIETSSELLHPFYVHVPPEREDEPIIGLLRASILGELEKYNQILVSEGSDPIWTIVEWTGEVVHGVVGRRIHGAKIGDEKSRKMVGFSSTLNTSELRSGAIKEMCERWHHAAEPFGDLIAGKMWRYELYPIYSHPFILDEKRIAFAMERAATPLFGVVTYGVHLTMYTADYRVWVPRRAKTKQTFGGLLDNTVAGGIPRGYSPFESIVKECMEEASLEEGVVRPNIKPVGAVSYFYQTKKGWLQPEVEYVYDLLIPLGEEDNPKYIPKPFDGEAESFEVCTIR
ncbi:hypothetical protein FRC14_004812 [Serendipita sp. 396]|nr:hypothetical protein FRC14_004812 [Serendipita sp. 396]KAG8787574.1 hypothetical protein FRC15_008930 [Serendipita sp. 397]KAG8868406.1 hypothetical protein FRC20_003461 [Serendipita sp. 405]